MSISKGTIVTRYNYEEDGLDCDDSVCVGHIVDILPYSTNLDNPVIVVRWYTSCGYHNNDVNSLHRHLLCDLWEIGQIPQMFVK